VRLSAFPRGLLSLLGAQNFGVNVKDLADVVSPVVDIAEQYLADRLEITFGGNNAAGGFVSGLTIPTGEVWKVYSLNIGMTTGVGVTIAAYAPAIKLSGVTYQVANPRAMAASSTDWNQSTLLPMFLPAGTEFGGFYAGVVGAPLGSVDVLFARLKA